MSRADGLRAFFIRLGKFSELLRSGGLPMPPRPPRLLLGELTDNQRAVVMTLMTGCCAVLGFMVQNKLDERWGGLQEVRTT